jgi:hypothetical protein
MVSYFFAGVLWVFTLEMITAGNPEIEWTFRARLLHTLGWPISLLIFLIEFFRNL